MLAAAEPPPTEGDDDAALIVDLKDRRVIYRGHEIPTRPPNNLQRQPLLALAVLASRPGEVLTMAELAEGMFEMGALRKRPTAPDARDLRYKILRPIRRAVSAKSPDELGQLVESVVGVGMRLNATAVLRSSMASEKDPKSA